MSAHFFHGSLDDEIRRELNKYLAPLQDYVNRNKNVRIINVRISQLDYKSIQHLMNLFQRTQKVSPIREPEGTIGFFGPNGWVKIVPVD